MIVQDDWVQVAPRTEQDARQLLVFIKEYFVTYQKPPRRNVLIDQGGLGEETVDAAMMDLEERGWIEWLEEDCDYETVRLTETGEVV